MYIYIYIYISVNHAPKCMSYHEAVDVFLYSYIIFIYSFHSV